MVNMGGEGRREEEEEMTSEGTYNGRYHDLHGVFF
jgi:hypothetical protein